MICAARLMGSWGVTTSGFDVMISCAFIVPPQRRQAMQASISRTLDKDGPWSPRSTMLNRLLTFGTGLASAAAIVWLTQGLPSAQAQNAPAAKPAAKPATAPAAAPGTKTSMPQRTKDGHPDLSGMYDVA